MLVLEFKARALAQESGINRHYRCCQHHHVRWRMRRGRRSGGAEPWCRTRPCQERTRYCRTRLGQRCACIRRTIRPSVIVKNQQLQHRGNSRSAVVQTALIRVSLLLLDTLSLARVGRRALVGIAIPASAGGVVVVRKVVVRMVVVRVMVVRVMVVRGAGALTRIITRDAADQIAEDTFGMVRSVTGAGAIDVADAATAGRVL